MAHIHEKIDFTVEVFVVYENKVLLRKHDKYKFWLSVGGHIELDEDPNEAAVREVKEEIALDVTLSEDLLPFEKETDGYKHLIPPKFMNRHKINDTHEHVTLVYFGTVISDNVVENTESEKSDGWKWFTLEELEKNEEGVRDTILFYAKRALQELSSK